MSKVCGPGVSPPQGRAGWAGWGKSRQCRLPGRAHALRGVSFIKGGYLDRHMFLLEAEVPEGRSSRHTVQAQLSKLQAGLADDQCHLRASHWMCPKRGSPRSPPRGRGRTTISLPVRPSAGSRCVSVSFSMAEFVVYVLHTYQQSSGFLRTPRDHHSYLQSTYLKRKKKKRNAIQYKLKGSNPWKYTGSLIPTRAV